MFYRIELPMRQLEKHGHEVTFRSAGSDDDGNKPVTLRDMEGHDVIVGQRYNHHRGLQTWRRARTPMSRLVYETDDDVFTVTPENWAAFHLFGRADIQDAVTHGAEVADLITVTTPHLAGVMAEHTGNPNIRAIPNFVPEWVTTTDWERRARPAVGWQGGGSHGVDVGLISQPVRRFLKRFPGWDLRIGGTDFRPTFKVPADRSEFSAWIPAYEDQEGFYGSLDWDIGLAPLAPRPFNDSKSNIKVLEYAARGIPSIASDHHVYRSFIRHGENGFLVKFDHEWLKYMSILAEDDGLRAKMGEQARRDAVSWTIEGNYQLWEQAYSSLFKSSKVSLRVIRLVPRSRRHEPDPVRERSTMTRVLLTGAGGFAGAHCLEHLLATTDWDVVITDSFRHKGKTERISEVLDNSDSVVHSLGHTWRERVTVITHDLSAPFSSQGVGRIRPIDYVIAYASDSHVDRSILDPVPFVLNNTGIALTTLELCRRLRVKALLWVSTDEVYGPTLANEPPFEEWSAIIPSNPYAASKAAQEALCTAWWRTYDVPVILVNAMNMFGERQDPEKFIPMTIRKVLAGEKVFIHGNPDNIGTRHWLHSRNLADGIVFLLQNNLVRNFPLARRPARFNIASSDRIDNLTLARMISEIAGKTLDYELVGSEKTRPGHDLHYGLDPRKIGNRGWKPPVPFAESLRRTVLWTMEHKEWLED